MPNSDLKIVAFGDSLTKGDILIGDGFYVSELERLVRTEWGIPSAIVMDRGIGGA